MGADNWAICPKCNKEAEDKYANAYGNVSESEYQNLIRKVDDHEARRTLREDYEIYISETGRFCIGYSAHCNVCKFQYSYDKNEELVI
jgi:hypothetical protein